VRVRHRHPTKNEGGDRGEKQRESHAVSQSTGHGLECNPPGQPAHAACHRPGWISRTRRYEGSGMGQAFADSRVCGWSRTRGREPGRSLKAERAVRLSVVVVVLPSRRDRPGVAEGHRRPPGPGTRHGSGRGRSRRSRSPRDYPARWSASRRRRDGARIETRWRWTPARRRCKWASACPTVRCLGSRAGTISKTRSLSDGRA
jgi:hypothetical protein